MRDRELLLQEVQNAKNLARAEKREADKMRKRFEELRRTMARRATKGAGIKEDLDAIQAAIPGGIL